MKDKEIDDLLKKTEDLKELFIFGQRVIPFLEEIFSFVKDIKPVFDDINKTIDENISKMPDASEKLSKVTEANEIVTTEIMDTIDKLFLNSEISEKNNIEFSEKYSEITEESIKVFNELLVSDTRNQINKDTVQEVEKILKELIIFNTQTLKDYNMLHNDFLREINNHYSSIMMSLQVQDITSQQIAAVDYMIKEIEKRLKDILVKFNTTDISQLNNDVTSSDSYKNITKFHRDIAFDPDAVNAIEEQETRQKDIDNMFLALNHEIKLDDDSNKITSKDDIDEMFSK